MTEGSSLRATMRSWSGLGISIALYLAQVAIYARHLNDDAFITFRYSRFLASGLGPYFNVGEHVEGYTNFLQMLFLAAVYAIAGESSVPLAARGLGVLAGASAIVLTFLTVRRLAASSPALAPYRFLAAGVASSLVAVVPGYAANSTSGLETTLFAAWVALGCYLGVRSRVSGRFCWAGLAWGAAALTRPEGVAVFAVWSAAYAVSLILPVGETGGELRSRALRDFSVWLRDAVIVIVLVGTHEAFRFMAYDGQWLPNTFHAKSEGFWGAPPWDYIRQGALRPFVGIVGVLVGLLGWWRAGSLSRFGLPVLSVGLAGVCLPFVVGGDWMPGWRFSVPYLPILSAAVVLGWLRAVVKLPGQRSGTVMAALAIVVVALMALRHHPERLELKEHLDLRARGYVTGHRALADWLRDELGERGATVALMDIGMVGYYLPGHRILDITGLTDSHIAHSPGPFLKKRYDPGYVLDQHPEAIVLVLGQVKHPGGDLDPDGAFGNWIDIENRLYTHPEFAQSYQRVREPEPEADILQVIGARFGADRVFPHTHPDRHYLLAVFLRKDRG